MSQVVGQPKENQRVDIDEEEDVNVQANDADLEARTVVEEPEVDIEHLPVPDDPRIWSNSKKNYVLFTISLCSACASLGASIYFPAIDDLQKELKATDSEISLSVSLFILTQGTIPLLWSAFSELYGRKRLYLCTMVFYIIGAVVGGKSNTINVFIGMRILQAVGGSAVFAIGGGTLSDIYDTHERGTKVGIYYMVPLLGQSIGPLIGGGVTRAWNWRATFYLLAAYAGVCVLLLLFFPETFRKERSAAWRTALDRAIDQARAKVNTNLTSKGSGANDDVNVKEKMEEDVQLGRKLTMTSLRDNVVRVPTIRGQEEIKVKISARDLNPLGAVGRILRQSHNILPIVFSGLVFGAQYCINFTAARDLATEPYGYNSLQVGLVLLSFGVGNIIGSVLGGRYSDVVFARLKRKNNGVDRPEMRIRSIPIALAMWPPSILAYAWVVDKGVDIWWCCIVLTIAGFSSMWAYTSILAYIVDKNKGRASNAVACNSCFRGAFAMIASESALPLEKRIGNGWFYTIWFFLMLLGELSVIWVGWIDDVNWKVKFCRRTTKEDDQEAE